MSEHALTVLEFHRALEQVAGHATSEAGRAAVLSLRPHTDREWVERELTRVSETAAFLEARSTWAPPEIPDCLPIFRRLAVDGSVLEGTELHAVGVSLVSGGQLAEALDADSHRGNRGAERRQLRKWGALRLSRSSETGCTPTRTSRIVSPKPRTRRGKF